MIFDNLFFIATIWLCWAWRSQNLQPWLAEKAKLNIKRIAEFYILLDLEPKFHWKSKLITNLDCYRAHPQPQKKKPQKRWRSIRNPRWVMLIWIHILTSLINFVGWSTAVLKIWWSWSSISMQDKLRHKWTSHWTRWYFTQVASKNTRIRACWVRTKLLNQQRKVGGK